jgi:VWFA-related protein
MPAWKRTAILVMLSAILALTRQSSAQQAPGAEGVIRINVNLVQVDAIVTDAKGKPVRELTADDFEVFQDGKPQVITTFAFINVRDSQLITPPAPRPAATTKKGAVAPPPPPPIALRPDQIRRTMALVVDDLGLSADSIVRVRDALKKWVDKDMQPGDLVAVIRTSAGMGALQQFTNDKRMLYAAIDLVQFHLGRVGVSSFAPLQAKVDSPGDPRDPDPAATAAAKEAAAIDRGGLRSGVPPAGPIDTTVFDERVAEMYTLGSIGAIQYVVTGLHEMPGRKSVVVFSESLRFTFIDGANMVNTPVTSRGLVDERLRRLTDAANRSSVVIYAIDPRGVVNTAVSAEDVASGHSPGELAQVATQRTRELIESQDGMLTLTEKTGGLFLHNNDVPGSLREVVDDGNGYYLLGYQPDAATFDEKARIPKFHTISVRMKKPGLRVRSRTGFFGTADGETPAPVGRVDQIRKAFMSPFSTGSIHVRLTTLFSYNEKEGPYINALLYFDARDLMFAPQPDGKQKAQIDTFAATFDVDGEVIDSADKTWSLDVEPQSFDEVLKRGMVYSLHVPVKKSGAYQMRMVIRDSTSEQVGTATQFVEVPDLAKGRLALSGLVLAVDRQQRPNTSAADAEIAGDDWSTSPAVRIFKAGIPMVYAYQIFNARLDRAKKPQLEVQTRLFKEGQEVYTTNPTPLPVVDAQDAKRLISTGRIRVSKAPPGHYALQVIVTDKLAKKRDQLAAQSMDFDIQ